MPRNGASDRCVCTSQHDGWIREQSCSLRGTMIARECWRCFLLFSVFIFRATLLYSSRFNLTEAAQPARPSSPFSLQSNPLTNHPSLSPSPLPLPHPTGLLRPNHHPTLRHLQHRTDRPQTVLSPPRDLLSQPAFLFRAQRGRGAVWMAGRYLFEESVEWEFECADEFRA